MEQPRVIDATFADWRTVKGRKMLQLIFEVPLEKQGEVLTMLGAPDPANPTWCAVAVLDLSKPQPLSATREVRITESNPKERRPFNSLPLSQQAAIRCQDRDFQKWLKLTGRPDDVAACVRSHCGVDSRSEFDTDTDAAAAWRKLELKYQAYLTDRMYPEEARR